MGTLELYDTDNSVELYIGSEKHQSGTTTDSAEFLSKRNYNNPLLKFVVTGSILLSTTNAYSIENKIVFHENIENLEQNLLSYNKCIELPLKEYIKELSESSSSKFNNKGVIKDVISFKSLTNSWDGYSAIPLEVESASNVISLMQYVGESFSKKLTDFYPNPNGTISFEWSNDSGEIISLEIGNLSMSYYVELNSNNVEYLNNVEINAKEASKLLAYINRL